MEAEEIARRFPEAVSFARSIREQFGNGVRLVRATNATGEQLGKPEAQRAVAAPFKVPNAVRR